jgi:hypothetical protein
VLASCGRDDASVQSAVCTRGVFEVLTKLVLVPSLSTRHSTASLRFLALWPKGKLKVLNVGSS